MHKRPSLSESIAVLTQYKDINDDCKDALEEYYTLKTTNEFLAARMVVDIVDHFNHIMESEGLKNGTS